MFPPLTPLLAYREVAVGKVGKLITSRGGAGLYQTVSGCIDGVTGQ